MHQRISTTLKTLRQDLATGLGGDFIVKACRAAGHTWSDSCLLTPAAIIHWFLVQIFHGNTALHHVSLLAGRALHRVRILSHTCRTPAGRLSGGPPRNGQRADSCHREGGTLATIAHFSRTARRSPDTIPQSAHFGQPGGQAKGCGFPDSPTSWALFHAGTGLLLEVIAARRCGHDMAGVLGILPLLMAGDVLVADRGFCSFCHLAAADGQEASCGVSPAQKQIVDFTPGRASCPAALKGVPKGMPRGRWVSACGLMDQVVEYFKPVQRPKWMSEDEYRVLPESIMVRELRYRITAAGFERASGSSSALGCRGVPG